MLYKINDFLRKHRRKLVKITVLAMLALVFSISFCCYDNLEAIPAQEYGLVLGTSKYVGRYQNQYFSYRIAAAAQLYHAGKIKKIIVSGDNMRHGYNEPEDMQQSLIELKVKSEDIFLDYAGFRTLDSVVRARNVFNVTKFIVISQKFHCARAIFLAEAHDLEVIGYAAQEVSPHLRLKTNLREPFACLLAWADVNILN
ncbi:MAG: ElyC/SanA/YdcF family protein, partial [Victivallaceae bacterium]